MPNVFPMRGKLQILHVGFQYVHLNSREPKHRPVVVDESRARMRSCSPNALPLP